ncbi:Protocadherin [Mactra antiquata]
MSFNFVKILLSVTFVLVGIIGTSSESIEFSIKEEQPAGIVIGNILEKYSINRDDLRFTLMKQGNSYESMFEVDEISGNLTTTEVIDREILCEFTNICEVSLDIAAQTVRNDGFFDVVNIIIIIEDINDNAPTFDTTSINVPVSEAVLTGASFMVDGARDRDTSERYSLQDYELRPVDLGDAIPFTYTFSKKLDGSSTIKLIVTERLDRESRDSYQFYIIAMDGGDPKKTGTLLINVSITDINDNEPKFDKTNYNVTINEEAKVGDVILKLSVTDKDIGENSDVSFRLSEFQDSNNLVYFAINAITGELTIKQELGIDARNYFKLIVEAEDSGNPALTSQTFVYVTVLDTSNAPPEIHINLLSNTDSAKVSEYANLGAVVAHVAVIDHDTGRNGDVNCTVMSDVFSLHRYDVHEYKVSVSRSLDRERADKHDVTISCEDKGVPPLKSTANFLVHVQDENDNTPRFRQQRYFANIDENNEIGDRIISVSAFDLDSGNNSRILYSVDTASSKYAFVNAVTGEVMANKVFDKEAVEGDGVSITIYARDQGSPSLTSSTTVIITINDMNDERPILEQPLFRFWVDENLPADTIVGRLTAIDKDRSSSNKVTRYSIKPGNSDVPFVVMTDGAVKTNKELDREDQSVYTFEVMAIDVADDSLYSVATATVSVVDKNDNKPVIRYPTPKNNTVYVSYLTKPNSKIYQVVAVDSDEDNSDNSRLKYTVSTINTTDYFTINSRTGEIILTGTFENKNSIGKVFILLIKVSDNGDGALENKATLRVVISENGTAAASSGESNKNFVIVVVVAAVTVLISSGIIVTICIIRRLDNSRRNDKHRQKVLNDNMYAKNNEEVDNIFPLPMDTSFSERKKKEVSFSLEENGMVQSSQVNHSVDEQGQDSFEQVLLEPPPQYQLCIPKGKLDDCHSDMSGESAGDSGKGGSDDDLHIPHGITYPRDDIHRCKDKMEKRKNNSPSIHPMTSFPTSYNRTNSVPHQKIIPFSFKTPSYTNTNNVAPTTTGYNVPAYYDDETRSSSGFHSVDSNSNFSLNNIRNGGRLNLHRDDVPDCTV